MRNVLMLLALCGLALGAVAMFEQSFAMTIVAICVVGFALGYMGGLESKTSRQ